MASYFLPDPSSHHDMQNPDMRLNHPDDSLEASPGCRELKGKDAVCVCEGS